MALNLAKAYTPTSGQVANSSSYNTDMATLFNAFSGIEAQTSTLGALTITPSANSTTIFKITNAAGTELLSADTANSSLKIKATAKLYLDGGTDTYLSESAANTIQFTGQGYSGIAFDFTTQNSSIVSIDNKTVDADNASVRFRKSRNSATVVSADYTGAVLSYGHDGTGNILSAGIYFKTEGTIATNRVPGAIEFWNHPDTTDAATLTLAISSSGDVLPKLTAGTQGLGSAVNYWADVSYKTLTDRGCIPWCDEGVELQDGRVVSDTEALLSIQKHPTKITVHGLPMLDYKTFPKVSYKKAAVNGILIERDENDEPKEGNDGVEMTSMFGIIIGAIKELTLRVKALETQVVTK